MKRETVRQQWDSGEAMLMSNPALLSAPGAVDAALSHLAEGEVGFATSGSTGEPKLVIHSRASLEASARMVIGHLGVANGERWLRALPIFHVGGFGVELRSWVLGQQAAVLEGRWDAGNFCRRVAREEISWSSLVPAQLADLVVRGERAPARLRGIVVGGGKLDIELARRARALGWPVVASYGMTEAASQVATGLPGEPPGGLLRCLDGWQLRIAAAGGVLELKGAALAAAYLVRRAGGETGIEDEHAWQRVPLPGSWGWFRSSDFVELRDGASRLRWLGRADSVVKILGELVALDTLQENLEARMAAEGVGNAAVIVDVPGGRDRTLVLAVEGGPGVPAGLERLVARWNAGRPGFEHLERVAMLERLPRSALGKVQLPRVREALVDC